MSDIAIKVDNLSKIYHLYDKPVERLKESLHPFRKKYHRDFYALNNVSFEVKKGETVGIIGKNGSGKSTLLKILTGVLTPTSGNVFVNGKVSALLELGAGFNPEFTGIENIYFNGTIMGYSKEEMDRKLDDILSFADIGDFVNQPVKIYSSGMFVRLAFAVATNVDPDILIVDEALAVGDAFFVQKCMRYLHNFKEKGTLLFVSHDMGAILNLTNKTVLLINGQITLSGSPKEVTEKYLEKFYESIQGESVAAKLMIKQNEGKSLDQNTPEQEIHIAPDNSSHSFKDIKFFDFNPQASSFGKGGAKITKVFLCDSNGNQLPWFAGGEQVQLHIQCKAFQRIISPIIGFQVKDRLGQNLFGDVTSFAYIHRPLDVEKGDDFGAEFHFDLPILPDGDYSLTTAIAEGTQENHIQHHWIHDALFFKMHPKRICFSLFGVKMSNIILKKYN